MKHDSNSSARGTTAWRCVNVLGLMGVILALSACTHGPTAGELLDPNAWVPTGPVVEQPAAPPGEYAIRVPHDAPLGWYGLAQTVRAVPGAVYHARAEARKSGHRGGGAGTYFAVDFLDDAGQRLGYEQSGFVTREDEWQPLAVRFSPPPGTRDLRAIFFHNGTGDASMRGASLRLVHPPQEVPASDHVVLSLSTRAAGRPLIGIGFEDDGWTYNAHNAAMGLDEDDYALREQRLRHLAPSLVRMFMWYPDWVPGAARGDFAGGAYTFDSDNMASKYRTLDLYQELGASVILCGVEWGMAEPLDHAGMADSVAALLEHLVHGRGYTNIIGWTVTNEPDIHPVFRDFDTFMAMTAAVDDALRARGLDIPIVGSDETSGGWPFFQHCVSTPGYHGRVGIYSSHHYSMSRDPRLFHDFTLDRVGAIAARGRHVPFIIGEFGFQDNRASGSLENPFSEEPEYALLTADFAVQSLAAGAQGLSFWCAHEVYYPGADPAPGRDLMRYGLWHFKDRGFALRPSYHVLGALSRNVRPGMSATRVETTHPAETGAVAVDGDTLLLVNRGSRTLSVEVAGAGVAAVIEEWSVSGSTIGGPGPGGAVSVPPATFAVLRLAP